MLFWFKKFVGECYTIISGFVYMSTSHIKKSLKTLVNFNQSFILVNLKIQNFINIINSDQKVSFYLEMPNLRRLVKKSF